MEAIILAGGFGTRLKHIVPDVPKPMAPVRDKPFLEYILTLLLQRGCSHVVLAVGYLKEQIITYFGTQYHGMQISYSEEIVPLFTGGAIKKALTQCREDSVFVLNGDTFFDVNLAEMQRSFERRNCVLMIAVKQMHDFSRYGTVTLTGDFITAFQEKKSCENGLINGGIYLLKRNLLDGYPDKFSFEQEVMEKHVHEMPIGAFESDGYFIDIGVPEDYFRAQSAYQKLEGIDE